MRHGTMNILGIAYYISCCDHASCILYIYRFLLEVSNAGWCLHCSCQLILIVYLHIVAEYFNCLLSIYLTVGQTSFF